MLPESQDDPNRLRPKRAPSSSAKSTNVTVHGGVPASAIVRSTSSAPRTPSAPSSQPPFGTESMCDPITTVSGRAPSQARPQVARLVDIDGDGQLAQPVAQKPARVVPFGGPAQSARAAGAAGEVGERSQVGDGAVGAGGDIHLAQASRLKRGMMCSPYMRRVSSCPPVMR